MARSFVYEITVSGGLVTGLRLDNLLASDLPADVAYTDAANAFTKPQSIACAAASDGNPLTIQDTLGATGTGVYLTQWKDSGGSTIAFVTIPGACQFVGGTFTAGVNVTGTVQATAFSGDGSALSNLNASQLVSGTVPDARLSANVPLLSAANSFTAGPQTVTIDADAHKGLVVAAHSATQSGNLQEWQDSGGNKFVFVGPGGTGSGGPLSVWSQGVQYSGLTLSNTNTTTPASGTAVRWTVGQGTPSDGVNGGLGFWFTQDSGSHWALKFAVGTTGGLTLLDNLTGTNAASWCLVGNSTVTGAGAVDVGVGHNSNSGGLRWTSGTGTICRVGELPSGTNTNANSGTFNPSSGNATCYWLEVKGTVNQSGSASGNYTAIVANITESAFLGTTGLLLDLQIGGTSRYKVDNGGNQTQAASHGEATVAAIAEEEITLSTSGTTTDSSANLLPANAIILAVTARVTQTITTATDWKVGDATTANRFTNASASLTAGSTAVGLNHQQGSVATDAAGPVQTSAAKVRITTTGTPGAGKVRVAVHYLQFTAPTS